ncbi:hypothetical protein Sjap_022455 [Stephania japonica]|uniref:Uncharacterized protein n=1 Tax=Stephania japonica TaxID=461633 RepID=A0AAP0HPW5_9MAGN
MVTGNNAWNWDTNAMDMKPFSNRIIGTEEVPEIPSELSEHGKDFLAKCWQKDCKKRWTAEMLNHPFVAEEACESLIRSLAAVRSVSESRKSARAMNNVADCFVAIIDALGIFVPKGAK